MEKVQITSIVEIECLLKNGREIFLVLELPRDFIREDDRTIVGFASFRQAYEGVPPAATGPVLEGVAHVGAVFVSPAHWRRGIARRMLEVAEDAMRERGFARAILWTPEGAPAERLYSSLGWELDGRRMWHDWVGVWVVGYAKAL